MKIEKMFTGILITGMIAGLFFGIQFKTGVDVNPDSIAIKVGKVICQEIDNPKFSSQCNFYMLMISIVAMVIGIIEIFATISQVGNWLLGVLIFAIGFIFALAIVLGV